MGQRTQIIVRERYHDGKQYTGYVFPQCGDGSVMAMELSMLINAAYDYSGRRKLIETLDYPDETYRDGKHSEFLEKLDFSDLKEVADTYNHFDNNNGGLVVDCKQGEQENDWDIHIGFLIGEEDINYRKQPYLKDSKAFEHYHTATDYMKQFEQCQDGFIAMFEELIKFYGVSYFNGTFDDFHQKIIGATVMDEYVEPIPIEEKEPVMESPKEGKAELVPMEAVLAGIEVMLYPSVIVCGKTIPIKSEIKQHGGTWDRNHNGWVLKPEELENVVSQLNKVS
jgi:hypothetical protein